MALKLPRIDLKNPKIRNVAVIVVCGIGLGVAWYQMICIPKEQELQGLESEMSKKQAELNSMLAMKPQLEKLKQDTALARVQLDSLKSIFPDQKEIPKLIREITRIAHASGIEAQKFSPLPDVEREYYVENRYSLVVVGGYHQVANFFSFLANLPLLVNLSEVSLRAASGASLRTGAAQEESDETPQTITASFKMTTFSSKK